MWVLLDESQGKNRYFKGWSDYRPTTTDDLQEAHTFNDRQEARDSAAYRFKQSSFVPIEVQLAVKNKAA
jgi:hypothetical protein